VVEFKVENVVEVEDWEKSGKKHTWFNSSGVNSSKVHQDEIYGKNSHPDGLVLSHSIEFSLDHLEVQGRCPHVSVSKEFPKKSPPKTRNEGPFQILDFMWMG
jgi:hypothetical protein